MGKSYIVVNDAWYNGSGEGNPAFSALGTISELKIAAQIRSYNDADGEHNPAFMAYRFDDSETWKELELSWFKYQDNDNWFGTPDGTGQVAADGFAALADGDHSIELYFYKPSTAAEGGEHHKIYDNNNGNNFKATFKKGTETPQEITYKVKVPAGTTECWIGGDWEKNGNWTFRQMGTVDAIDHQFELKVENQLASFKYKYCSSNDWDHKELKADGTDVADRTFGDSIDVVAKFKVPAVTEWFIKGSFNGWADGYKLEGTDNTALSVKIALDANKKYEFKILRVNDKDSVWFGLPSAGNNMKYGECTDWVAYKSEGEQNQANVGLISTKAQDYTFTVDVTNTDNGNVAPKFSVDIPEPEGINQIISFTSLCITDLHTRCPQCLDKVCSDSVESILVYLIIDFFPVCLVFLLKKKVFSPGMTVSDKHNIIDDRTDLLYDIAEVHHQFLFKNIHIFLGGKDFLSTLPESRPDTSVKEIMTIYNKCKTFHIINITNYLVTSSL